MAANVLSLPLRLKVEGDERTYKMEIALKIDSIIPED